MDINSARVILISFLWIHFSCLISPSFSKPNSLLAGESITGNDTLVSTNNNFVLGFFTPAADSSRWYLGIWYKTVADRVVVWVANREAPISRELRKLSLTKDGNIVITNGANQFFLFNGTGDKTLSNSIARLTEDGNFAVMDQNSNIQWQSFDHPTDTLLPGMKLGVEVNTGVNSKLTSWKSVDDPSPGKYSLGIDIRGVPQLVLYSGSSPKWRLGPWNGKAGEQQLDVASIRYMNVSFHTTKNEVWRTLQVTRSFFTGNSPRRNESIGQVVFRLISSSRTSSWGEECSIYLRCGAYSICAGDEAKCSCMEGFELDHNTNNTIPSSSSTRNCIRKVRLDCTSGSSSFVKISGIKLPDTSVAVRWDNVDLEDCKRRCMTNCSCMAYSNVNFNGSACLMWLGDLVDVRMQPQGPDVYVKVQLQLPPRSLPGRQPNVITIVTICVVVGTIFLVSVCFFIRKHQSTRNGYHGEQEVGVDLPILDYATLATSTHNFSNENKLGEGGFGPVYKGTLADGQEVAIKRLSRCSNQGIKEFRNEVLLIAKLQHRNLVRLLACCIHDEDRMLIYEYMSNKSLDGFIFGKAKNESLNWQTRNHIIMGITRGILYLHQDSRLRIIHRDLKASNILLDKEMNPKISDFGTARIIGGDETEALNTHQVVGTYGYMSPEYALHGIFSVKSDVFSFGVLLLEIISGTKNKAIFKANPQENLVGHAWALWSEGKGVELIDPSMFPSSDEGEVLKYIKVGLLCVQEQPDDRPSMSYVLHILSSNIKSIPEPKKPEYLVVGASNEMYASSSVNKLSSSSNNMSATTLEGR